MEKLTQQQALYYGPELNHKEFTCSGCGLFQTVGSNCAILKPTFVNAHYATCELWIPGPPVPKLPLMRRLTREQAGYDDHGPFTCKRCEYANAGATACEKVEGRIDPNGCCGLWDKS